MTEEELEAQYLADDMRTCTEDLIAQEGITDPHEIDDIRTCTEDAIAQEAMEEGDDNLQ